MGTEIRSQQTETSRAPRKTSKIIYQDPAAHNGSEVSGSTHVNAGFIGAHWFVAPSGELFYKNQKGYYFTAKGDAIIGPDVGKLLQVSTPLGMNSSAKDSYFLGQLHVGAGKELAHTDHSTKTLALEGDFSLQPGKEPRLYQLPNNQIGVVFTKRSENAKGQSLKYNLSAPTVVFGSQRAGVGASAGIVLDNGKPFNGNGTIYANALLTTAGSAITAGAKTSRVFIKGEPGKERAIVGSAEIDAAVADFRHGKALKLGGKVGVAVTKKQGDDHALANYGYTRARMEGWFGSHGKTMGSPEIAIGSDLTPLAHRVTHADVNAVAEINARRVQVTPFTPGATAVTLRGGASKNEVIITDEGRVTRRPRGTIFGELGAYVFDSGHTLPIGQVHIESNFDRRLKITQDMNPHEAAGAIASAYRTEYTGATQFTSGKDKGAIAHGYFKDYEAHMREYLADYADDGRINRFHVSGYRQLGVGGIGGWKAGNNHPEIMAQNLALANPLIAKKLLIDEHLYPKSASVNAIREMLKKKENAWMLDPDAVAKFVVEKSGRAQTNQPQLSQDEQHRLVADLRKSGYLPGTSAKVLVDSSGAVSTLGTAKRIASLPQASANCEQIIDGVKLHPSTLSEESLSNLRNCIAHTSGLKANQIVIINVGVRSVTQVKNLASSLGADQMFGIHDACLNGTNVEFAYKDKNGKCWSKTITEVTHNKFDIDSGLFDLSLGREHHDHHSAPKHKLEPKPTKPQPVPVQNIPSKPVTPTPYPPPKPPVCNPVDPGPPQYGKPCPPIQGKQNCEPVHSKPKDCEPVPDNPQGCEPVHTKPQACEPILKPGCKPTQQQSGCFKSEDHVRAAFEANGIPGDRASSLAQKITNIPGVPGPQAKSPVNVPLVNTNRQTTGPHPGHP